MLLTNRQTNATENITSFAKELNLKKCVYSLYIIIVTGKTENSDSLIDRLIDIYGTLIDSYESGRVAV